MHQEEYGTSHHVVCTVVHRGLEALYWLSYEQFGSGVQGAAPTLLFKLMLNIKCFFKLKKNIFAFLKNYDFDNGKARQDKTTQVFQALINIM